MSVHSNAIKIDRLFAMGDSLRTIACSFRIGRSTIPGIVSEIRMRQNLKETHVQRPSTVEDWYSIGKRFEDRWNFLNCLGAIDGKDDSIKYPANSGLMFYYYMGTHTIVLIAIVDAE